MRYPKRIKYRGRVLARIYGNCKGRDSYRVAWHVAGQRRMASFPSYSLAKRHADALVRDLAKGSQVTALHPAQARDALAALERLADFYRVSGRRVSLLAAVSEFVEASGKLHGRTMGEAVEGYLRTAAVVRRRPLAEAVREFCEARKSKAIAQPGKRPALHPTYVKDTTRWLNEFATMFPAHAVVDLTKDHLNAYAASHSNLSAKSRNDRRAVVKMFLGWCARQYYPHFNRSFPSMGIGPIPRRSSPP